MFVELFVLALVSYYIFITYLAKPKGSAPGPYRLPIIGNLHQLGEFPQIELVKMGKIYGPIISVKFGSMEAIVINDYKLMKEAFALSVFNSRPNWPHFLVRSNGERRGMIMNQGQEFLEQRKVILRTLKDFGMGKTSMENLIKNEIEELIETIKLENGAPLKLDHLFSRASINALMVILFGERMNQDDPEFLKNLKHVEAIFPNKKSIQAVSMIMPWLLKISKKYTGFDESVVGFKSIENLIRTFVNSHIKTRTEGKPRDFTDAYLDEMDKPEKDSSFHGDMGMKNLVFSIFDFYIGGGETSKTVLNWACVTLVTYPEIQDKLIAEMKRVAGDSCPSLRELTSMPYFEAFLFELFRHNTLGPLGFPRMALEDTVFHGYKIKAGTSVIQNIYAAHMDEAAWGDPENFRPERFLDEEGKVIRNEAFLPFGSGRRICPGESLARDTVYIFLTNLIHHLRITPDLDNPVKPNLTYTNTLFTTAPTYSRVSFVKRNNA